MVITAGSAILGGGLIGMSASLLLIFEGRIAGISGIVGGLVGPRWSDVTWRLAFIAGLLVGGVVLLVALPNAISPVSSRLPLWGVAVAGLLTGFGTRLGHGCTSGHGVCGLSRGSVRSLAAVITFMVAGAVAAFAVRHILPGLT